MFLCETVSQAFALQCFEFLSHSVIPTAQELLCLLEGTVSKAKGAQPGFGTCPAPLLHSA